MGYKEKYCIWSSNSIGGLPLEEESEHERIPSIIVSIAWCFPTLRVWLFLVFSIFVNGLVYSCWYCGFILRFIFKYMHNINTNKPNHSPKHWTQEIVKTLRVGKHHTMDPIMEGILSCSLASSRGNTPIELPLQIQYFSSYPITFLEPLYIVLPSPKKILEEESSWGKTF
jgi:hypothetical protein